MMQDRSAVMRRTTSRVSCSLPRAPREIDAHAIAKHVLQCGITLDAGKLMNAAKTSD